MDQQGVSRRDFLAVAPASVALMAAPTLAGCGGSSLASVPAPNPPPASKPPNVLLFLVDDQRNDTLGCAGHPVIKTPNIDALAARGTRFENAFVTTSICAASRASIFTGLYERTHQYTFEAPPIRDSLVAASYPVLLRQAGFRTGFIGKFGVEVSSAALDRMFTTFRPHGRTPYFTRLPDGTSIHETDLAALRAIDFLGEQEAGQPFCLSVSFNAVHAEDGDLDHLYPWPPSADGLYEGVQIPLPRLSDPAVFEALPAFLKNSVNRERFFWCCDTPEKYQRNMRGYFRMISGVDAAIGRVLQELRRLGLDDNTVVLYMADNGYYMGDRGFAGKWSHYEQSLRIPLVIADPRVPSSAMGRVESAKALNVDIAPTLLQLAGLRPPESTQGRSLLPLTYGNVDQGRSDEFFCEHLWNTPGIPRWEGVRAQRYVYARYFDQMPVYEFLHDLEADPDELTNLAASPIHSVTLAGLRERCAQLAKQYEAARTSG